MSTFKEFRESAKTEKMYLESYRKPHDDMIAAIKKNYQGDLLQRELEAENAVWNEKVGAAKGKLTDQLNRTAEAMLASLKKGASTPPTPGQLALLQAFSLRSNFTQRELEDVAAQLSENYVALKTLKDIAASKGFYIYFSVDYDQAIEDIGEAVNYGKKMLEKLGTAPNDLDYYGLEFFGDYEAPSWNGRTQNIDGSEYAKTIPPKVERREITEAEQEMLESLFERQGMGYADQINAVRKAAKTPELKRLIELSKYAVHLEKAENEQ